MKNTLKIFLLLLLLTLPKLPFLEFSETNKCSIVWADTLEEEEAINIEPTTALSDATAIPDSADVPPITIEITEPTQPTKPAPVRIQPPVEEEGLARTMDTMETMDLFYSQDFESTCGWSYTSPGGYSNYWVWGSGGDYHSSNSAVQVWQWCDGGKSADYWSVDYGAYAGVSRDLSKTFDFSSGAIATASSITFTYWVLCDAESGWDDVRVLVEGSEVSGPWTGITTWTQKTIDLSAQAGNSAVDVIFRWRNDGSDQYQPGARIDDIAINYTPGADPCDDVISIGGCGSGYSKTYTGGGSGSWNTSFCGWSTPGIEQVYSFVAPYTGTYSIEVTAASGYVDYGWRASSCAETGWNCIDDIYTTGTYGSMSWTASTTYYILLDDENSTTGTHTFYINCPCPTPANPGNPTVTSYNCGSTTITRSGSPPAGETWYWQGTSCGTSTALGSGSTYNATSTNTYYIRSRKDCGTWSTGCGSVAVTVYPNTGSACPGLGAMALGSTYTGTLSPVCSDWSSYTSCAYTEPGDEVVYTFTPEISGYHLFTCSSPSGGDADFFLMSSCGNSGTNYFGGCFSTGTKYANLTKGTTYYLIADNYSSVNTASYSMKVTWEPCYASNITAMSLDSYYTGTLGQDGAWDGPYSECGYSEPGAEKVYSFACGTTTDYLVECDQTAGDCDFFLMSTCGTGGDNLFDGCVGLGDKVVSLTSGNTYYLIIDNYSSASDASYGVRISLDCNNPEAEGTWVGDISTNWFDSDNWGQCVVPNSGTTVTIPAGCSNYPNISSSIAYCSFITVNNGASLTISGSGELEVTNEYYNSGTLTISGGTLDINDPNSEDGLHNYSTGQVTQTGGVISIAQSFMQEGGRFDMDGGTATFGQYLYHVNENASVTDMTAGTMNINGNFPLYEGSFWHSGGTINDNGYYRELDAGGGNYYGSGTAVLNLTGSSYIRLQRAGSYFNNVTISGTYNMSSDNTQHWDVNGNITVTGTFDWNDPTDKYIYCAGNWNSSGATITQYNAYIYFDGSGANTITTNGAEHFNYLQISKTGNGMTLNGNVRCEHLILNSGYYQISSFTHTSDGVFYGNGGELRMTTGIMNVNRATDSGSHAGFWMGATCTENITGGTINLTGYGLGLDIMDIDGNFTPTGGEVVITGATDPVYIDGSGTLTFYDLTINRTANDDNINLQTSIGARSIQIDRGELALSGYTVTTQYMDVYDGRLNIGTGTCNVTGNGPYFHSGGRLTITTGTLDCGSNIYFYSGASGDAVSGGNIYCAAEFWVEAGGSFTPSAGNVTMDGAATGTIDNDAGASCYFYNLYTNKSAAATEVNAEGTIEVNNQMFINTGTFDVNGATVNIEGPSVAGPAITLGNAAGSNDAYLKQASGTVNITASVSDIKALYIRSDGQFNLSGGNFNRNISISDDYDWCMHIESGGVYNQTGGTFRLDNQTPSWWWGNTIDAGGDFNMSGGTFYNDNCIYCSGTMDFDGGTFYVVSSSSETMGEFYIYSGGRIDARNTTFTRFGASGVYFDGISIQSGAQVGTAVGDDSDDFDGCTFSDWNTGGRALTVANTQSFTIATISLTNTAGTNIYKTTAGNITVTGASTGTRWGELYDSDAEGTSASFVDWPNTVGLTGADGSATASDPADGVTNYYSSGATATATGSPAGALWEVAPGGCVATSSGSGSPANLGAITCNATITWNQPNSAPTVAPADITESITDMYPTISYNVQVAYHDADGYADLEQCRFKLDHPSATDIELEITEGGSGARTVTVISGSAYLTAYSANAAASGNDYTVTWTFTLDWDWTENTSIDYYVWCDDVWSGSDDATKDANDDYENDMIFSGEGESGDPAQDDGVPAYGRTGNVYFEGSTTAPANVTGITVYMEETAPSSADRNSVAPTVGTGAFSLSWGPGPGHAWNSRTIRTRVVTPHGTHYGSSLAMAVEYGDASTTAEGGTDTDSYYSVSYPAYDAGLMGIGGASTILTTGDDVTSNQDLGFDFLYYGTNHASGASQITVGSNGYASPGNTYNSSSAVAWPMASATIAGLGCDWELGGSGGSGSVYRKNGANYVAFIWYQTCHYSESANYATFEVVIYDNSDILIQVDYIYHFDENYVCGLNRGDGTDYEIWYNDGGDDWDYPQDLDNFAVYYTYNQPPPAPTLAGPFDNYRKDHPIRLEWNDPGSSADYYKVRWTPHYDFDVPAEIDSAMTSNLYYDIASGLGDDSTYYWQVCASNNSGSSYGDYSSEKRGFTRNSGQTVADWYINCVGGTDTQFGEGTTGGDATVTTETGGTPDNGKATLE